MKSNYKKILASSAAMAFALIGPALSLQAAEKQGLGANIDNSRQSVRRKGND